MFCWKRISYHFSWRLKETSPPLFFYAIITYLYFDQFWWFWWFSNYHNRHTYLLWECAIKSSPKVGHNLKIRHFIKLTIFWYIFDSKCPTVENGQTGIGTTKVCKEKPWQLREGHAGQYNAISFFSSLYFVSIFFLILT